MSKEVGAGGRFDIFLDSGYHEGEPTTSEKSLFTRIGSKTIQIVIGADRSCMYWGPGVSKYFWASYPNSFRLTFISGPKALR